MVEHEILAEFPVEFVLPLIGTDFPYHLNGRGKPLSLRGNRWRFFLKGTACVECGRIGKVFRVIRETTTNECRFLLYSEDDVLMTKDHIVPKSRYAEIFGTTEGRDSLDNLQCMCELCNHSKDNLLIWKDTREKERQPWQNLELLRGFQPQ